MNNPSTQTGEGGGCWRGFYITTSSFPSSSPPFSSADSKSDDCTLARAETGLRCKFTVSHVCSSARPTNILVSARCAQPGKRGENVICTCRRMWEQTKKKQKRWMTDPCTVEVTVMLKIHRNMYSMCKGRYIRDDKRTLTHIPTLHNENKYIYIFFF